MTLSNQTDGLTKCLPEFRIFDHVEVFSRIVVTVFRQRNACRTFRVSNTEILRENFDLYFFLVLDVLKNGGLLAKLDPALTSKDVAPQRVFANGIYAVRK